MESREDLLKEIACLESSNDHLYTEMAEIDRLLRKGGFPEGLISLLESAEQLIEEEDL